ncbi:Microfilament motor [Mycena sanguinolenta]|uniref:Microfilament motor n=1 Tax=Mycena sanguinolenta TaxID=230812 RepID=A0A8H6XA76_9AGAR|nr:Microfilament motor [Mycena sanguinolenta]
MSDDHLDSLLQKTQQSPSAPLLPDELAYLITAFLPSQPAALRSKAYLVLSAFCQGVRNSSAVKGKQPDPATETLVHVFEPVVVSRLADSDEGRLQEGISFLTALFQVDWESASPIFQQDGILDFMMDSVDLKPSAELSLLVAHLLSQACGHKSCRGIITSQTTQWLEAYSRSQDDPALRAATSIALVKLSRGRAGDTAESGVPEAQAQNDDELADVMKGLVISSGDQSSIADAVEGLAYLSVDPTVKDGLSRDPVFLKRLFSLVPRRKTPNFTAEGPNTTLLYGVLLTISNLCTYRPRLTEEQAQIAKLKRMANATNKSSAKESNPSSALDDDENVKARVQRLVAAGVLEVFAGAVPGTESLGIRVVAGKALLNIVEDRENRGRVLQSGGAKLLGLIIKQCSVHTIIRHIVENTTTSEDHALAKLAITSSPVQVFGPNDGAIYDAIRPFSIMLQHSGATLLQRFEALMALTNLSSHSAETAARVAKADGLLGSVELLLLEEHELIRRASMELICNLISGSDAVFERYGGAENTSGTKSKLQIVLAMSDVEDLGTRLAASGALATLTDAPSACEGLIALQRERHRMLPILAQLIDPSTAPHDDDEEIMEGDPGLVHRGIVCARNVLLSIQDEQTRKEIAKEAGEAGLVQALVNVVKSSPVTGKFRKRAQSINILLYLQPPPLGNFQSFLIMAPSKKAGKKVAAAPKKSGGQAAGKVAKADWKEGFKKKQVGVSDMTLLTTISNESINQNLQKRWTNAEIYTYIGAVLISVNPFRDLGIYNDETLHKYRGKNRLEVPPHVFSIAESSYYNMNAYHENQCVIISGESGAGKTEAAKRIMQYIAAVSSGQDTSIQEIKDMGKYLEIMFNTHGEPVGAQITNYLLEKGRVVGQIENERDFHIFYQFTKGASSDQREMFGLQGPEAYVYTSQSNCLDVPGIDDVEDYGETIKAMQVIGLGPDEQTEIFRMLAIILWLGNVQFNEMDDGNSAIADPGVTDFVGYLMEVDAATVQKVLTSKVVETQRGGRRGSVYDVPLNPAQAGSARDALAKAIYNNLFEWIVSRINVSMKPRSAHSQIIGILDIFGFEIFEDNSFEQLCINYVNEKLQQIFIELTLKTEQEEYVREQIKWNPIKYFNNKIVCDLIEERRPPGIFAALNDACATAHADPTAADSSFMQRASGLASNPHFESRGGQFLVRHYAGDVMYNVSGMTDKNKDTLNKDLLDLVATSGNQFLQTLFPDRPDPNSKKRPPTAGDRIKAALVDNLMKAQPSYIRTIKPNQNRSSSEYDTKAILHQIKYLGLEENIRVRRAGFAYRNTFEKMVERFYLLSPQTSYAGEYTWHGDAKSGCEQILKDTGIAKDEWQMGVTKAFIKNPRLCSPSKRCVIDTGTTWPVAYNRFWKNNKEALVYAQVRDYGHQVLAGRKERRRFSLLSYRRFMGDYLDVNGKSPLGEELGQVCGIGNDQVTFSGRIQLLVSKLGRSSKPSPRFLLVTQKAVHIVVTQAKDGRAQTTLERKIPLVTIKSIGMSNLRDDWMCLNGNTSEEGDPIFSCYFKTELAANLLTLTQASITLLISPTITYSKKKDKKAEIKFIKDETVKKDDLYKSHTVHVPSGEPAGSLSRPPAKRKPGIVRPITQGKLLKAGGPSDKPKPASKPKPAARPLPGKTATSAVAAPVIQAKPAAPKPATTPSAAAARAPPVKPTSAAAPPPPPPPPPPPAAPAQPAVTKYRAKFDFTGEEGEMSLTKDDVVELVEQDDNGWWLVKKGGVQGWAPNNYLELVPAAAAPAPPPPARRPVPSKPAATSVTADASAKPVAVFPGMAASNGSATPWKKTPTASSSSDSPANSRPGSSLAGKAPPPVAAKPKPAPPVGTKPAPKVPGKPAIPTAPRPTPSGGASKPVAAMGGANMDLAAALAKRAQQIRDNE